MSAEDKKNFFDKYKWIAIFQHIRYGIPASITLAQASIESNYGTSNLATKGNNFFGIKAYSNPDNYDVIYANDDTAHEPFRKYDSAKQSFKDHSQFLIDNSRYNNLFSSNDSTYWANTLQTDGYATSQNYASTIISRIKENDLTKYDFYGNNKYLILFFILIILAIITFTIYKLINKK